MRIRPLLLTSVLVPLLACSGSKENTRNEERTAENAHLVDELKGAPQWVRGNCNSFFAGKQDVLCAAGDADGIQDMSLLRDTATERARANLAERIHVEVKKALKDFVSQDKSGKAASTMSEQERTIIAATDQVITGSQLEDSWISPKGRFYALVSCSKDQVTGAIGGLGQLPQDLRDFVASKAKSAFDALESKIVK